MEKRKFSKLDGFLLVCVCIVAVGMRLYKINAPLSDFHSWRQADTAAVARNYAKNGIDLLRPQYDDLSSIQSGQENPQGLRFVEFPLYNAIIAAEYMVAPFLPIEVYGRLTTIFFSLIIISIIYYLLFKEHSRMSAFIASSTYAVFPAFVFFSRVVLPETPAVAFAFLAIFFAYRWSYTQPKNQRTLLFASSLSMAISILIKPTGIFYLIPIVFLLIRTYKLTIWKRWEMYVFPLVVMAPFIAWRLFIQKFPEGIPASDWLITSVNTYEGQKVIFMKPAFFRWIIYERINIMICGAYLTFFLLTGLVSKLKSYFLHFIFAAALVYLFVFQGGNVQHEYYQTLILAPIALFVGIGTATILKSKNSLHPVLLYPLVIAIFIFSFSFSYYYRVKDFYSYPEDLNQMARILDSFSRESDKVITDRLGDTTLLYLANRKGAPMLYHSIPQMKELGYTYYMTDKKEIISELKIAKEYALLFENSQFALFKL